MAEYILPTEDAVAQNIVTSLVSRALFVLDKQTPGDEDTDYKPLYYGLFNGITTILENAQTYEQAVAALKQLQCEAEDAYIGESDAD
jgi:hypothetical protein